MRTLIVKLNAAGDVVRTTTLLNRLEGETTWITAAQNTELLDGVHPDLRCLPWERREEARDRSYDLVINLEDEVATAAFSATVAAGRRFGACLDLEGRVAYSCDSSAWFDLSLVSVHGRERADYLKLQNRRTYQDLVFSGLGWRFEGDPYLVPQPATTGLVGDVAIAPAAGPVWPMKGWAYYEELQEALESAGYEVNVLPWRATLREHLADIAQHECLVGGDSLPMHLALGCGVPCVTLFNCTSPWEIYDYGIQTKLVSPLLDRYFYRRDYEEEATRAIRLDDVFDAVIARLRETREPVAVSR